MRMMQYELKLFERGYVVTNGPMRDYDRVYEDKCSPIKLTVLKCRKDGQDATIADIILDDDEWGTDHRPLSKYFQDSDGYQEILCGQNQNWYLYSFEVAHHSLTLNFYNPKESCSDYIILTTKEELNLKVQFDLLRDGGGPGARYLVSVYSSEYPMEELRDIHSTASVIEYYQGIRRELEFWHKGAWIGGEDYVYVTEYVDL